MRKFTFILVLVLALTSASAQHKIYDFKNSNPKEDVNYKALEPIVLEVANLLLTMPVDKDTASREEAIDLLYNWMIGTPDYVFGLGRISIILGEDFQLTGISFAAQVKYALENQASVRNDPQAHKEIWITIAHYINDKEHNVRITPKLKELLTAYKEDKMNEFLEKHE